MWAGVVGGLGRLWAGLVCLPQHFEIFIFISFSLFFVKGDLEFEFEITNLDLIKVKFINQVFN